MSIPAGMLDTIATFKKDGEPDAPYMVYVNSNQDLYSDTGLGYLPDDEINVTLRLDPFTDVLDNSWNVEVEGKVYALKSVNKRKKDRLVDVRGGYYGT